MRSPLAQGLRTCADPTLLRARRSPASQVIVVDNFFTGSHHNLRQHLGKPNFELIRHDVVEPILIEVRVQPFAVHLLASCARAAGRSSAEPSIVSLVSACLTRAACLFSRWTKFTTWPAPPRPCTTSTTR